MNGVCRNLVGLACYNAGLSGQVRHARATSGQVHENYYISEHSYNKTYIYYKSQGNLFLIFSSGLHTPQERLTGGNTRLVLLEYLL